MRLYDPFQKLEYVSSKHMFIPKQTLPMNDQKRIAKMISILGINEVSFLRRKYFSRMIKHIKTFKLETWDDFPVEDYPTAHAMIKIEECEV
jgi:hypothetical protein